MRVNYYARRVGVDKLRFCGRFRKIRQRAVKGQLPSKAFYRRETMCLSSLIGLIKAVRADMQGVLHVGLRISGDLCPWLLSES